MNNAALVAARARLKAAEAFYDRPEFTTDFEDSSPPSDAEADLYDAAMLELRAALDALAALEK